MGGLATILRYRGGGAAWKILLTAFVCGALYRLSVGKAAASFERGREELRRRLT